MQLLYVVADIPTEWRGLYDVLLRFNPDYCYDFSRKDGRDKKPWYKPCKSFKQIKRRVERARLKVSTHRMRHDDNTVIQDFPDTDVWEWT